MKRNCICCLLSAMMIAAACCISAASSAAAEPPISAVAAEEEEPAVTHPVDWSLVEPAVTQPVRQDAADPKELYGLKAEPSAVSLKVGEKQKLTVTWDGDVYRTDILRFQTDNKEIVAVNEDGMIEALSEGTATVSVIASLDSKKITLRPSDYGTRTVEVKVTVTDPALSDTQRAALQKLKTIEQYRTYPRERAVIRGQIAPDAPRFTMDEVNKLIEESASFSELYDKIRAAQKYPDVYEDIEQTYADYWFNNRGTEGIAVLPDLERVYYFRLDDDGYCHEGGGMIYPEREEPSKLEKPELDRNFRDFNETYGGTYTPAPQEQLYGLTLLASWDEDCYLEHPVIQSSNNGIALVYYEGLLFAQKAGRTTVWVKAKLDPEKVTLAEGDDGTRTVRRTITVMDETDLTDVQKAALEPIGNLELSFGKFPRAKAVIKGFLAVDAPRLTLDAVSQMLEVSDDLNVFMKKLTDAQPYPDACYEGGITCCEYWLDDKGTEKIGVNIGNSPGSVWYSKVRTNGSIEFRQTLYPTGTETYTYADGEAIDLVYRAYNDVTDAPTPGDANCDGSIDVADAVLIARFAAEDREAAMTDQGKENADVNHNGSTDGQDAARILQYIAKRISYEELTAEIYDYTATYVRTYNYTGDYTLLPLVRQLSSLDGLNAYIAENAEALQNSVIGEEPKISFADAAAKYTKEWFDTHKLLVVCLEEGSGSVRHEVTAVSKDTVCINRLNTHVGTCDMAYWHILIELDKSAAISDSISVLTSAVD